MDQVNSPQNGTGTNLVFDQYKLLTDLLKHEEVLIWQRNQFFFAFNGALLAVFGWLKSTPKETTIFPPEFAIWACIIGICMCLFWFLVIQRGRAFYDHWFEQLKDLEKNTILKIFGTAEEYFAGKAVNLSNKSHSLPLLAGCKIAFVASAASLIFAVAWVFLALHFWRNS
ncbi:hypothetical protein L0222_22800 [bacterium]|nr:hypothetical protein [bacterium]